MATNYSFDLAADKVRRLTSPSERTSTIHTTLSMVARPAVVLLCVCLAAAQACAALRYVNLANPSPAPPYTTWASAATNIQDAIDAADAGDEIVVTDGMYETGGRSVDGMMTNRVAVTKPVTLRSVNGPDVTVIRGYQVPGILNGDGAIRCVYLTDGAGLVGFTLTNGATLSADLFCCNAFLIGGGGVFCASASAIVSNCVLSGNSAGGYGGGACGGTVNNCVITRNSAANGGGTAESTLNNCTLINNSAGDGGGAYSRISGTLNNCMFNGNSAYFRGGGVSGEYSCVLNNCTFTSNSASWGGGVFGQYGGTLNNCTLTGNSASDYGGGVLSGGTLNNCTIIGNSAPVGGGVCGYLDPTDNGTKAAVLNNSVVYYNSSQDYFTADFSYSCTTPLPPGPGNIDEVPGFVDLAARDFRLLSCSPCIDAGTNLSDLITTDIFGIPRPLDGNGDGVAAFDMGAYEFDPQSAMPLGLLAILREVIGADGRLRVSFAPTRPTAYYGLYRGASLTQIGTPVALELGEDCGPLSLVDSTPVATHGMAFYRVREVPNSQPLDSDGDGIDDVYELRHSRFLDPLNSADAAQDYDGDGRSNLAEYRNGTDPERVHQAIASGLAHTVVLKQDGSLWAWGDNAYGQLGDGTFDSHDQPVRIGMDTNWISVSASRSSLYGDFTVALRRDGSLWWWGSRPRANAPARLCNERDWAHVSAGGNYIVAVTKEGSLCFPLPFPLANTIGSDSDWVTVAAGGRHVLALKADRSLWALGDNRFGQCGLGDLGISAVDTPTRVGTDNDWIAIAASGDTDLHLSNGAHSLALKADGTLWAWGLNDSGELGVGDQSMRLDPTRVGADSDWTGIAAGCKTSVARKRDGSLWAWGLGASFVPRRVDTNHNWREFSAGGLYRREGLQSNSGTFAVAIQDNGSLWSWNYESPRKLNPTMVGSDADWALVSAGVAHSIALKTNGTLWAWGSNEYGELGNSSRANSIVPQLLTAGDAWQKASAGYFYTAAIDTKGTLWTWGANYSGQLGNGTFTITFPYGISTPQSIESNTTWEAVSAGGGHTAALRANGSLWAWGWDYYGQLGNGIFAVNGHFGTNTPQPILTNMSWRAVSAGHSHTVAIRDDGTLWTWGANGGGQLGNGSFSDANTPQPIVSTATWKAVSAGAGGSHTTAIRDNGSLWAWGYNDSGQLGNGTSTTTNTPQLVQSDATWKAVAVGNRHTVALRTDGTLWTWGANFFGQLGNGTLDNASTPQPILPNMTWKAVATANIHTLAIREDGTLWSWGDNFSGQLGIPPDLTPTRLGTDTDWGAPP